MGAGGDSLPLLGYWSILVRRRWSVILVVTSITLIALIGSLIATPLYKATATLQIERKNPDILTFGDLGQIDYAFRAYQDFYQTQYKIMASPAVARKAVERMGLTSHPLFESSETPPGLLSRIRSLLPKRTSTVEREPVDIAATMILSGLEVIPVRDSHLVKLSWNSSDPELAAQVANAVSRAYVQFNLESKFSTSGQAEEFLVNQIGMLKREIALLEEQLQDYGESKRIVSIDDSNNITLQALKAIAERRTESGTTLATAEAAFKAVLDAPAEALPEVINSTLIARLRQEYAAYEAEYTEKSGQFKEDWPVLQNLKSKLDQARKRLELETELIAQQVRASAKSDYLKALNELENFEQLLEDQETAVQRLKRDAVEFANLQSEVQKKRETLDALIGRQNEMALSTRLQDLDTTTSNIRIMELAKPPVAPFRPNTKLNVILGFLLGLVLGVALALSLDFLDNTISSVDQLESVVSLPTLAVIPRHGAEVATLGRLRGKLKTGKSEEFDLVAHLDGRSGASEAYRELRTSILLSNPGSPPRRIMVTSALPEEGKTATAINLAVVLAQLRRRVLLVDTDLRRPRLHKAIGVENVKGVSTFLSGMEQDPQALIVPTGIEGLDLFASGPIPPNPAELLNSTTFTQMGATLLERGYDHILFDSPPVLSVSDPVIIASTIDAGILVVRAGLTPRQSVRAAAEKLQQADSGHLGIVLNDVDTESLGSYYHKYHYYGRYGEPEAEQPAKMSKAGAVGS